MHQAADLPSLLQTFLAQHVQGESQVRMRSDEIAQLARISQRNQRQLFALVLGFTTGLGAAVFYIWQPGVASIGLALVAVVAFILAWPRKA